MASKRVLFYAALLSLAILVLVFPADARRPRNNGGPPTDDSGDGSEVEEDGLGDDYGWAEDGEGSEEAGMADDGGEAEDGNPQSRISSIGGGGRGGRGRWRRCRPGLRKYRCRGKWICRRFRPRWCDYNPWRPSPTYWPPTVWPPRPYPNPQHCSYNYFDQPMTWFQARTTCRTYRQEIATPKTHQAQTTLTNLFGYRSPYWIGLTDAGREGYWYWTDNSPLGARNWKLGEPNGNTNQNCAQVNYAQPGKWDDVECWQAKPFVCQSCYAYARAGKHVDKQ